MKSLINTFFITTLTLCAFVIAGCSSSNSNDENAKLTGNAWCMDDEQQEIAFSTYLDTTEKFTFQQNGVLKIDTIMDYSYSYGDNWNRHNENATNYGSWTYNGSELVTQIDEESSTCKVEFINDENQSFLKLDCIAADGENDSLVLYSCK